MGDSEVNQTCMVDPCINPIVPVDFLNYVQILLWLKNYLKNVYRVLKEQITGGCNLLNGRVWVWSPRKASWSV